MDNNTVKLWYKNAIFYEVYVRAYADSDGDGHGDLRGLISRLDYLQDLGIDCLWLMPIYPSPLKDDGYDIADYCNILPEYGNLADFQELITEAHKRGIRIITDLVLNHTSDQHPWFQAARTDRKSPFRDYYVWSDSDQKYQAARIIFLDSEVSNWTWDPLAGQYYWHRFYASQPDLNFDNPLVQDEMLKIARFWLDLGVDGFRVDAVPYLFEREGTNCENLPETHYFLKRFRHFVEENYPGRILLCEANQWPEDVRPYFGDGDEFHIGFHFPVMPRIFMALRKGDREALEWILNRTPAIPPDCQWCVFLRNHDELTLEMVTEEERQWMWLEYAPQPRMRLNLGIRRRLAPLLENNQRKIEVANSLLFSLPGVPIIYYGDEIGMGDLIELPDRNGVRTPMQWSAEMNAGFSSASPVRLYAPLISDDRFSAEYVNVERAQADPRSLLHTLRRMIAIRKKYLTFGWGAFEWADCDVASVAAYWRRHGSQQILIVNNLSNLCIDARINLPGLTKWIVTRLIPDKFRKIACQDSIKLALQPYEYLWLQVDPIS